MAKQTFTVGQVLTAAQLTSLQQTAMDGGAASAKTASYTLVAADAGGAISMTSTSATTITVNTGLFAAGDTVYIQNLGSGVCTITAGTATVNTSAALALAQYEGGTLDFISSSAAVFFKAAGSAAAPSATFVGCLLYKSGNQAVAYDTTTIVSFDTEIVDTDGFHDNSTNNGRITIPTGKGGKYLIQGYIASQAGNNGRSLTLFKNNSAYNIPFYYATSSPGGANMYQPWALVLDLAAADYVDTRYDQQDSSGSKNVYGGNATQTVFGCTYLGA
jgi:hypothetical protein